MRRLAVLLAVALAFPASADGWAKASQGWAKISQGGSGSYATIPSPTGCTSGMVPYFNSSLQLVCSPTVYAPATDTTTATGTVAARNLTATALATPVITPPVSPVLSLLTTVTVVAGASLVDGDYFTLSDGSAVVYEFDNDATVTPGRVPITFAGTETAQEIRDLVIIAINGSTLEATAIAAAADTLTVTSDTAGDSMGVNSENVADPGFLVPVWGEPTHATTYGYKVEACLADGSCAPSAEVQTTTGHATLSNANYNSVTWGAVTGASYYKLTRVTGTPAGGDAPPRLLYTGPLLNFSDTNATSTSEAVATGNETGVVMAGTVSATHAAGSAVVPFASVLNRTYGGIVRVSTTITAALAGIADASVAKRYLVYVPNGTYAETVQMVNYVDVVGQSRDGVVITDATANHTLDIGGVDSMLANLTVTHTGAFSKYAIHADAGNGSTSTLRNETVGILYNVTASAVANPGIGIGFNDYQRYYLIDSSFRGTTAGLFAHNSAPVALAPGQLIVANVTAMGTGGPGFLWTNIGSGKTDLVTVVGGTFTGSGGAGNEDIRVANSGAGAGETYFRIDPTATYTTSSFVDATKVLTVPTALALSAPEYLPPGVTPGVQALYAAYQFRAPKIGVGYGTSGVSFDDDSAGILRIQNAASVYSNTAVPLGTAAKPWSVLYTQTTRESALPVYADNAAALTGGLVAGDAYRTSTGVRMVTY